MNCVLMRYLLIIVLLILAFGCSEKKEQPKSDSNDRDGIILIKNQVDSLNKLARNYIRTFPDSGISVGKFTLERAREIDYKYGTATALKNIGSNYWSKGYFDIALEYYYQSMEFYEKINDIDGISRIYNNIGLIYLTTHEFKKGIESFEKAIEIGKKLDRDVMLGKAYFNLGLIFNAMGEFQKSVKQIKKSIPLLKNNNELNVSSAYAQALCYTGINYIHLGEYDEALEYLMKSLELNKKNGDKRGQSMVYNHLSQYYIVTGEPEKALEYARKGYHISLDLGLLYDQFESTAFLSKAYANLGDFRKAYEFKEKNVKIKDSLKNEENIRKQKETEMEYMFSKKTRQMELEQQKKELELENKIYRGELLLYFITAALFLAVVFVIIIYKDYKQKTKMNDLLIEKNKLITNQKEELEHLNHKLDELNSTKDKFFSIIAHDLRNPIAAFKQVTDVFHQDFNSFNEEERFELIKHMKMSSDSLYQLLENLLTWSRSQRGTIDYRPEDFDLKQLIDMIINLLSSQAARKNIELSNNLKKTFPIFADKNMMNTTIRNLVSNAIKYTSDGGHIDVSAEVSGNQVIISVEDNGIGMDEQTASKLFKIDQSFTTEGTNNEQGTGLGLILCKEFVDKHGGDIWVESSPGKGSKFIINLRNE